MKHYYLKALMLLSCLLIGITTHAYDFAAQNSDGVTIYYNIVSESDKTCEVTYQGESATENVEYNGKTTIPETVTYNGTTYSVTCIGHLAFYDCTGLTSIEIPSSVTIIGASAFYGCTGLISVEIPNSVIYIHNNAFQGCTGLKELQIEDGEKLLKLGYNYLSNNGQGLFYDCPLETLYIGRSLSYETGKDYGYSPFYNQYKLKSVTIGNSVTSIGDNAFSGCTDLKELRIEDGNETLSLGYNSGIGQGLFYDCPLETLYIGKDLSYSTEYGYSPFYYKNTLKSLTLGNGVTSIGDYAFYKCDGLTSITIPEGVTSIGYCVFYGCTGLTSITIGNSVTSIDNCAFSGCTGLTSIEIPNSITSIGMGAFGGCTGLTSVEFNAENCTTMGHHAASVFEGCTSLSKITIGEKVKNIPSNAFYGCTGLTSVTIGSSVTSIGSAAFSGCTGLTSVTIPNNIKSIGKLAFSGCTGLTSVEFNAENCTTMGDATDFVFKGCSSLSKITIGEKVKNIPSNAFYDCSGLTSIEIPNSVTSIGSSAFWRCSGLTKITIPNSITNIGENAFYYCTNLSNIKSLSTTQTKFKFEIRNNTEYECYMIINNKKYRIKNDAFEISELVPYKQYSYNYGLIINNIYCTIINRSTFTKPLSLKLETENGVFYIKAKGSYTEGDATILGTGLGLGSAVTEYDNQNEKTFTNLDPNTSYTVYYSVNTKEGGVYSTSKPFTTGALTWSNAEYQATSTTSARLMTETNCDATEGTGFEWRRYGAPENLKPNAVACPVVDGMLVGSLRNLNSEAYYEFRPYYTSSSGKTYYGEWTALFTGDANVYFEPEVRTYEDVQLSQNTVVLKGYALAGTDEITSQGFEYWKSSNQPSAEAQLNAVLDSKTVTADGISMSALIENLDYGTTYCYRAFVTTEKGTVYGDTMEFTTENEPSGIEETIVDGCEDAPVEYYNLQGVRVVNPERGLYIKRQGGKTTKVVL